jgi:late competence protein required for DNA uptake (superfamily II DNA/RNA helicase)
MAESVGRGAQVFVFISRIRQIEGVVRLLRRQFPQIQVEGTSAADAQRGDRVLRFRERDIRILVTTTILERGVTVPKSDVYILDADDNLFNEAALVQMAGRAGRAKDDPAGKVIFGSRQWNRAQRRAVRQIHEMNRLARRRGYLLPANGRRWRNG